VPREEHESNYAHMHFGKSWVHAPQLSHCKGLTSTSLTLNPTSERCPNPKPQTQRWDNDANEEALAKERFEKRDFSVIFLKYECSTLSVENGALVKTDLTVPNVEPLTWDDIDAGQYEDGRFLEAATNLGYDEDEWNDHGINPTRGSGPPDNLVLVVENYLEGEAYYNLFFFTQIICGIIMVAVSLVEIKNIFLWWKLSEGPKTSKKWFFQTNSGVLRMLSGLGAVCQYVVVPVFTIEVSLLLILESANSVDVIKDTLVSDIYTRLHARTPAYLFCPSELLPKSHVSAFSVRPQSVKNSHIHTSTGTPLPAGHQQPSAVPQFTGFRQMDD